MYGGMCTGFYTQSLLVMQQVFQQNGIEAALSFVFNESLITRARNSLTHQFLKTDCTHLLFIDSDLRFDAHGVLKMVQAEKDVICGIYPKKEINWNSVSEAVKNNVPVDQLKHHTGSWVLNLANYDASATIPISEPFEIWAAGTGMMLIKREVFEKLKETTPTYLNDMVDLSGSLKDREQMYMYFDTSIEPGTNRYLSEDYHFCREWREIGGKVWAAPWLTPGHVGSYIFEGQLVANETHTASDAEQPSPEVQSNS
jgi:hypothetical protein